MKLAILMDEVEGDSPGGGAVEEVTEPGSAPEEKAPEPVAVEDAVDDIAARAADNKHVVALITKGNEKLPVQLKDGKHLATLLAEHGEANVEVVS